MIPSTDLRSRPPSTPTLTYAGVVVIAVGFALLALAWGLVAGETDVTDQLPALVAAGLGGLGVVMVGLTMVHVAATRTDDANRAQELDQLLLAVDELRLAIDAGRGDAA